MSHPIYNKQRFAEWAAKQPPEKTFNYLAIGNCPVTEYLLDSGVPAGEIFSYSGPRWDFETALMTEVITGGTNNYAALAKRLADYASENSSL